MAGKAATLIGDTMPCAMIVSEGMDMGMCSRGETGIGISIKKANGASTRLLRLMKNLLRTNISYSRGFRRS